MRRKGTCRHAGSTQLPCPQLSPALFSQFLHYSTVSALLDAAGALQVLQRYDIVRALNVSSIFPSNTKGFTKAAFNSALNQVRMR